MQPHQALLAALVVALLSVSFGSCRFTPAGEREPNWPAIAQELQLGAADLRDVALLVEDEPTVATLRELADVLDTTAVAILDGGEPVGVLDAIDRALGLADGLAGRLREPERHRVLIAILVARAGLRRAQAYGGGR